MRLRAAKRLVVWSAAGFIFFLTAALVLLELLGYRGPRDFTELPDRLPSPETVARNARRLIGTPYDLLNGRSQNLGGRMGCIVCADVPNLAYGLSGLSLRRLLEQDFRRHPEAYDTSGGNRPGNQFFHRRARNLYAYFRANNQLIGSPDSAHVGDLVFYSHRGGGPILHVTLVTRVDSTGYWVVESSPLPFFAWEHKRESIFGYRMVVRGLGRLMERTGGGK